MKIYRIEGDIDDYRIILPVEYTDEVSSMLDFDGTSKMKSWKPIQFYIDNPLKKKCDFYFFISAAAFACNRLSASKFMKFWNLCAELLPIYLEDGTELFVVNVVDCVNALDITKSQYDYYLDGTRSNRILKYVFIGDRLHESSIFKIPQTANTQILTYANRKSPEDEFYTAYMESGLEGLIFNLIYSDEL